MKLNKVLFLLIVIMSVFALAGPAFAANRVEVKVTSEPIPYHTECSKAGGFSLEFDAGSKIMAGDKITIDMPYKNESDNVRICRPVDMIISPLAGGSPWTMADIATSAVVSFYEDTDVNANSPCNVIGNGVYFKIFGDILTQRITIDVVGNPDDGIQVGIDDLDKFIIMFLDQKDEPGIFTNIYGNSNGNSGTYLTAPYNIPAGSTNNTLCVGTYEEEVFEWSDSTVNANMDSEEDKFTFIPTNPQIAHIAAPVQILDTTYSFVSCKQAVGTIPIGRTDQEQEGVCRFDFETEDGYCSDHKFDHRLILTSNRPFNVALNYQLRLEILVDGNRNDRGVYWSNDVAFGTGINTESGTSPICSDADERADEFYPGVTVANPADYAPARCDVRSRATVLTFNSSNLSVDGISDRFVWFDMPYFRYNSSIVSAGQTVSVLATLTVVGDGNKTACGGEANTSTETYTFDVGTFGECDQNFSAVFPYFTLDTDDGTWWSGMVITNLSSVDGTATLYFYEADGDWAHIAVPVKANNMYVATKDAVFASSGMVIDQRLGGGVLGDSNCYMIACTNFNMDGYAMIGNAYTGEGQGYLPRSMSGTLPSICK